MKSERIEMRKDPIVDELHAIRRAFAREHDNDITEMIASLRKRSSDAGRETVKAPAKRVTKASSKVRSGRRKLRKGVSRV
jgi:hypothetical protein